jgi:ParB/RepB/Spo0J family partition protein
MKVAKKNRVPALIRMLSVDRLVPTPDNRRRPITQASVESLAKSLAKDGVLQPIVVRAHPDKEDRWEIRAGERRWRAAKLAGLKEIPAIVRKLDDESALSVTIAENLQRQNLHPLEEAATIQQAFDRGYDVKVVAARVGKSVPYITRRASLSRLAPVWRDEVLRPDSDASRLSVAHLEPVGPSPPNPPFGVAAPAPPPDEGPWLLTPCQLAKLLGISRAKFFRMLSAGLIPEPIRFGRCVRWSVWVVAAWIHAGCPSRDQWNPGSPAGR